MIHAGGSVRLFVSSPALHCFSSRAIDVLLKTNSFLSLARLFSIFPLLFPFFLHRPALSLPRRRDGTLVSLSLALSPTRRFRKFPESPPRLIAIVEWANSRESANFSATFFLSHKPRRFFPAFLLLNCSVFRTPFLESLTVLQDGDSCSVLCSFAGVVVKSSPAFVFPENNEQFDELICPTRVSLCATVEFFWHAELKKW
jgi:hypothetical protein